MKSISGWLTWTVAGLALASAACGTNGSVTGPSAAAPAGASIQGTIQSAGSASASTGAVRAQSVASPIRVSVVGTSRSTVSDDQGRFRLDDVAGSSATLRFEAEGVDARGDVSGLAAGRVVTIEVQLQGSRAVISSGRSDDPSPSPSPSPSATPRPSPEPSPEPEPGDDHGGNGNDDNGAEQTLRGTVDSVTPPSLHVAGRLVMTDGSTRITRKGDAISLSDIHAGDRVEVEGTSRSDGSLLARKISLED